MEANQRLTQVWRRFEVREDVNEEVRGVGEGSVACLGVL